VISGHVVHGLKLGRDLGFPTLNLPIAHKRPALSGIFVVRVHGVEDKPLPGVASLGLRPTVDDSGRVLLEVHLLDWHGDAYGKLVRVEFLKKLRDEEKYVDLEKLSAAIARDVASARAWFEALEPGRAPGSRSTNFSTSATDRIR
jgi:riboflavin kinase/FMN adenylyltransferase